MSKHLLPTETTSLKNDIKNKMAAHVLAAGGIPDVNFLEILSCPPVSTSASHHF